jgi:hypothetical protein
MGCSPHAGLDEIQPRDKSIAPLLSEPNISIQADLAPKGQNGHLTGRRTAFAEKSPAAPGPYLSGIPSLPHAFQIQARIVIAWSRAEL